MVRRGHVPIRTCLVCALKKPKSTLLRLCKDPTDRRLVCLDPRQAERGRGAYVCEECLPSLRMSPRLRKAFRGAVVGLKKADDGLACKGDVSCSRRHVIACARP